MRSPGIRLCVRPSGPVRIGLHWQPPSRASCCLCCKPLSAAPLGCFPLEIHRTLAYRRGGQRAGGSVLLERCVRRRRRRSAPCHSKGAHAAERVRGLVAQGDRGLVLDAPAVLLFVAVDEFAVATKQWLTSVGHCGSPRSRLLLGLWGGISITVLGSQFWLFACSGTGAVKGICFATLDPAFL